MTRLALVAALVLVLPACGDDGPAPPGGADPVPPAEAQASCEDFAAHATACGWGGNVAELDWNCGEAALFWTATAFRTFVSCAAELDCGGMGATCYSETQDAVTPQPIHEDYSTRCTARLTECDMTVLLPLCEADRYELYATSSVEALIACFDEPCDMIMMCLETAL